MKRRINLIVVVLFVILTSCGRNKNTHWQAKKENSAFGLTLGYSLPEKKIHEITGDKFNPVLDNNGNGFLMLFIETSKQYNLNNKTFENMQMAHIAVPCRESITCPFTIASENQKIRNVYTQFNFKVEKGDVDFSVKEAGDSLFISAHIDTQEGNIEIKANVLNNPGKLQTHDTKVTASTPNSFFFGKESFRPVKIPSAKIEFEGKNWISQFNLKPKPDVIWLNTEFVWDFTFAENSTE